MKKIILLLIAVFCLTSSHFAQDRAHISFDQINSSEYFETIVNRTPKNTIFTLFQLNYPFSGVYKHTRLGIDGKANFVRVTPLAYQATRRGMIDELEKSRINRLLSDLVLLSNKSTNPVSKGDLYSVVLVGDGKSTTRLNFAGEIPDTVKEILAILNDAFERNKKKEQEAAFEENRLLLEKYGDWLDKPGIIRPNSSGTHKMNGNNRNLIYLYGVIQPIAGEHQVEVPIYYALISHPPPGRYLGGVGGTRRSNDPIYKGGMSWTIGDAYTPDKELKINYDAINYSIQIGDSTFELSSGNIFKIDIDKNWSPIVTQSPLRLKSKLEGTKLIKALRRAFSDESLEFER